MESSSPPSSSSSRANDSPYRIWIQLLGSVCLMSAVLFGVEMYRAPSSPDNTSLFEIPRVKSVLPEAAASSDDNSNSSARPASAVTRTYIIPPIIHQSWKSTEVPSHTSAEGHDYPYRKWIRSWPLMNEGWAYMFWTDDDNNRLFETNPLLETFRESYARHGGVLQADYARYAYLYVYGGVYADIDFECLKPFAPLAESFDLFLSSEPTDQTMALSNKPQIACNAIMGSRPMHPFWLKVLNTIKDKIDRNDCGDPVDCSGPRMLQKVYENYVSESWDEPVSMLPSQYFYPELASWNGHIPRNCETLEREGKYTCRKSAGNWKSFAVHHWACQWCRGHNAQKKEDIANIIPPGLLLRPF
eukprot:TRINITY_DN4982_c0_g2_i1.p1 TRINITY_DN4982_c0_g2~~TRINITY_DN4982_c0_g2_i1.p1  ORF type:complete len:358 (+),score=65.72 TRINITY_DN4982_c0_g2_i1:42-1115(+)